jgi:hypothetical protein
MVSIKRGLGAAALILSLAASSAAWAKIVVVRASGPSAALFKAGSTLDAAKPVALKANDTLIVLDGSRTRTLKGAGTFNLAMSADPGRDISASYASMTAQRTERRGRFGAVRDPKTGVVTKAKNPNLWYLDVERSGRFCVADVEDVTLWRPVMIDDSKVLVTPATGGNAQVMDWSKGEATRKWPAILPVADDARYDITIAGQARPTSITFALVDIGMLPLDEVVARLAEKGCTNQVDQLLADPDAPAAAVAPTGGQ